MSGKVRGAEEPGVKLRTFVVEVSQIIEVALDESKFDDAFMAEFQADFFGFTTLEEHAEHLAQLQARGIIDLEYPFMNEFVEGYGPANEMGLKTRITSTHTEVIEP